MSVRPKYFYKLSIYDSDEVPKEKTKQPSNGFKWKLGVGDRILGLVASSIETKQNFTVKAGDVKNYVTTVEGGLKLGFIASCACIGGIISLVRKPRGIVRKLAYPAGFLTISSAICYPSKAYVISKVCAVNLATGIYSSAKITTEKVNSILEERRIEGERKRIEEEAKRAEEEEQLIRKREKRAEEDEQKIEQEALVDNAPIRNAPVSDESMKIEESDLVVKSQDGSEEEIAIKKDSPEFNIFTTKSVEDEKIPELMHRESGDEEQKETHSSLLDFGQSSKEDTDLYTTRS